MSLAFSSSTESLVEPGRADVYNIGAERLHLERVLKSLLRLVPFAAVRKGVGGYVEYSAHKRVG